MGWDPNPLFNPATFCDCLKRGTEYPTSYIVVFSMCNDIIVGNAP